MELAKKQREGNVEVRKKRGVLCWVLGDLGFPLDLDAIEFH